MESTDATEPTIRKAFVRGLVRLFLIWGSAFALFLGLGKFFVRHAASFQFVSDALANWPGPHDWTFFLFVGVEATLFGVMLAFFAAIAVLILFAVVLEMGGKEVLPRW